MVGTAAVVCVALTLNVSRTVAVVVVGGGGFGVLTIPTVDVYLSILHTQKQLMLELLYLLIR